MSPENQIIISKPHHFFDVIKLYGAGVNSFTPDSKRGHDFHRVGNLILEEPLLMVRLTLGVDDVCRPCRLLENDRCVDFRGAKQVWNKIFDRRIFRKLDLKESDEITAIELCRLMEQKITDEAMAGIWRGRRSVENRKRTRYLLNGLKKYLAKFDSR